MKWSIIISIIHCSWASAPNQSERQQTIFGQPVVPGVEYPLPRVDRLVASGRYDDAIHHVLYSEDSVRPISDAGVDCLLLHLKTKIDALRCEYREWTIRIESSHPRHPELPLHEMNRDMTRGFIQRNSRDAFAVVRRFIVDGGRGVDEMMMLYRKAGDYARYIAEVDLDPKRRTLDVAMEYYSEALAMAPDSVQALEIKNSIGLVVRQRDGYRAGIAYLERVVAEEQASLVVNMATELTSPEAARQRLSVVDLMRNNIEAWKPASEMEEWVVV